MTAVRWVDGINGDDLNDGLTELTAWATLNHAGEWPNNGVVFIKDGVYKETLSITSSALSPTFVGVGDSVWIDGEGIRANCIHYSFSSGIMACGFSNLKLTGFTGEAIYARPPAIEAGHDYGCVVRNCLITQPNPSDKIGTGVDFYSSTSKILMINCQIERVNKVLETACVQRNNIFRDYNTLGTFLSLEYCSYPGGAGTNVNYTTTPPAFRDAPNWDYSVDPNGANAASYIANGWNGGNIGMQVAAARTFTSHIPAQGFNSGDGVFGDWINEDNCYDTSFPSTTITSGVNDDLDFDEAGAELTATIAAATYTTSSSLVAAAKAALDTAGAATFTVTWVDGHTIIASDGATLNLRCNTGTNKATSAYEDIGFSELANRAGALTYTADHAMTTPGSLFVLTVTSARGNTKLDFDEGGAELTATIADTTTNNMATLATAIKTALEAVGAATFIITWEGDGKYSKLFKVTSDGATLNLRCNTGTNKATSAYETIGFSLDANRTGALSYLADKTTTSTAWDLDADRRPTLSIDYESDGRMAQGLSPVQAVGGKLIRNIEWRGTEDTGKGRVFNADDAVATAAARTAEVRADDGSYVQNAPDSGLDHNFTKFDRFDEINWTSNHAQMRWTLRQVI